MTDDADSHFHNVALLLRKGVLIPFLGAGVNCFGEPHTDFHVGKRLPSGDELAKHLADHFAYKDLASTELARVAQYIAMTLGDLELYSELHRVFDIDVQPSPLHRLLARLPSVARQQPAPSHPLIFTTNYDDAVERAFEIEDEPFDTLVYQADGTNRGKILHRHVNGEIEVVRNPNKYDKLDLERNPVIVKVHGTVDRKHAWKTDSFVITEDHYIQYLTHTDFLKLLPVGLAERIGISHFLFLGYGLRDWNLRVLLHRLRTEQELLPMSWSVRLDPDRIETASWARRNVLILDQDLEDYVARLSAKLGVAAAMPVAS